MAPSVTQYETAASPCSIRNDELDKRSVNRLNRRRDSLNDLGKRQLSGTLSRLNENTLEGFSNLRSNAASRRPRARESQDLGNPIVSVSALFILNPEIRLNIGRTTRDFAHSFLEKMTTSSLSYTCFANLDISRTVASSSDVNITTSPIASDAIANLKV